MLPNKAARVFYADMLRAIAILAVIILHNAADYDAQLGSIPASHWWAGAIWNGLVRFCVPMFVALSGAFLLNKNKEVTCKEVFWKRLPKIIIPLIFWSVIYILYEGYETDEGIGAINWIEQLKIFYQGPVIYHFWFLYMMIGIYLLYPILNLVINAAKEIHIRYFLLIWFISNCLIKIIDTITDTNFGIEMNFFSRYIGYFVLGYYLTYYTFSKKQLTLAYLLGIIGLALSILMPVLCIHLHFDDRSTLIESDFTPDIALVIAGLILWFKNRNYIERPTFFNKIISQVSKESFGIYLVHVLVMEIIFSDDRSYAEVVDGWHPGWAIPLKAIIILLVSLLMVKIIRLIPYFRRVVG